MQSVQWQGPWRRVPCYFWSHFWQLKLKRRRFKVRGLHVFALLTAGIYEIALLATTSVKLLPCVLPSVAVLCNSSCAVQLWQVWHSYARVCLRSAPTSCTLCHLEFVLPSLKSYLLLLQQLLMAVAAAIIISVLFMHADTARRMRIRH